MIDDDSVAPFGADEAGPWVLETKGDEPASLAAMADFLARMRGELDKQFQTFADLRDAAAKRSGEDQPEAEAKLARADLKAAVEGLSVIVRTLEKIDQLERQLARDRAELEAAPASQAAYDALWADVETLIEARVEERLAERLSRSGPACTCRGEGSGPQAPPDPAAASGDGVAVPLQHGDGAALHAAPA